MSEKNTINVKAVLVAAAAAGIVTAVWFGMTGENGVVESQPDEPLVSPTAAIPDPHAFYAGTEALEPDEMRIVACGTGMPFARPSQAGACFLVELGNGKKFIFDVGNGSVERISAQRIPYEFLDTVFVSHLHTDHMGDLGNFFVTRMVGGASNRLHVYGPTGDTPALGTAAAMDALKDLLAWDLATRGGVFPPEAGIIEAHEFPWQNDNEPVYEQDGVVVRSWPAIHAQNGAVSYSLEWNGLKMVFGGDNFPNQYFIDYAKDADVVIHECFLAVEDLVDNLNFPVERALIVGAQAHTPPEIFGALMTEIQPRLAIAYHFWNDFDTAPNVLAQVRTTYEGPLTLANDYLVWNITADDIRVREMVHNAHVYPPPLARIPDMSEARGLVQPDWFAEKAMRRPDLTNGIYDRVNERYDTDISPPFGN